MSTRVVRLFLSLCAAFILVSVAACDGDKSTTSSAPDTKDKAMVIAVVNQEVVYRESQAAKAAVAHLDVVSDTLRSEIVALQSTTQKDANKDKGQSDFEAGLAEMQQRFAAEQQQVTVKVTALFEKTLEDCRKESGASIVVSSDLVLAFDETVDLTQKVLAEMNKTPMTFAKLGEEPAADGTPPANGTLPATNSTSLLPSGNSTATNSTSTNATQQ